jgi:hypothetical protein
VFAYPGLAPAASGKARARAPSLLSTSIKVALPPLLDHLPLFSLTLPSLGRLLPHYAPSLPTALAWTHPGSSVGLAAAENLNEAASLKPESSISHSGVDALNNRT